MGDVLLFTSHTRLNKPRASNWPPGELERVRMWLKLDSQDFVMRADPLELLMAIEVASLDLAKLEPWGPEYLQLWAYISGLEDVFKKQIQGLM